MPAALAPTAPTLPFCVTLFAPPASRCKRPTFRVATRGRLRLQKFVPALSLSDDCLLEAMYSPASFRGGPVRLPGIPICLARCVTRSLAQSVLSAVPARALPRVPIPIEGVPRFLHIVAASVRWRPCRSFLRVARSGPPDIFLILQLCQLVLN